MAGGVAAVPRLALYAQHAAIKHTMLNPAIFGDNPGDQFRMAIQSPPAREQ
jgi:hypothetical protein